MVGYAICFFKEVKNSIWVFLYLSKYTIHERSTIIMKKITRYGLFLALAMTFILGSSSSVSAKPIDNGHNSIDIKTGSQLWQSDSGIFWNFILIDEFSSDIDYLYVYGWDESSMSLTVSQNFDIHFESNINFKRGIATFTSSIINLTAKFETSTGTFNTYGTRRDGTLNNSFLGYGTITGTIIIEDVSYVIDGTFSDEHQLFIHTNHSITK